MTNRILSFDLRADGSLGPAKTLYQFSNSSVDGIRLDGKLVAEIPAGGSKLTNVCFWRKSAYVRVAERHTVHRLDVGIAGKAHTK